MFCRRRACALLALLLVAGCARRDGAATRKTAILPFENLSGDPKLDWLSRGFAEVLRIQLTGTRAVEPLVAASLREAPATGAARFVHGYFRLEGRQLKVNAVVEDAGSGRAGRVVTASGAPALLPLADAIARGLDESARPAGTSNEQAARSLVEALEAADLDSATSAFERAVQADAGFGPAQAAYTQWLILHGRAARAREVAAAALAKGSRFHDVERAQLRLFAAMLGNEPKARRKALADLARATPADPDVLRALADASLAAREYPEATAAYRAALDRAPDNVAVLNQLGYAEAYAGNLEGAVKTLERYRDLRPREANPIDSLGDVHFYAGRFQQAEKLYLEAYSKEPGFLGGADLVKAAWARLMTGDVKGADELFARFAAARRQAKDPFIEYKQAQWEFVTGRTAQALTRAAQVAGGAQGGAASLAASQLAFWRLELGNPDEARSWAMRARAPIALTAIARFLALPPAPPAEWTSRADKAFPKAKAVGDLALCYALLLSGHFKEAEPRLRELRRSTPPTSNELVDLLLAWALVEIEKYDEARGLLAANPIPEVLQDRPFLALSFPRLFYLRGVVDERQGRRQEARRNYELFLRLSGDRSETSQERAKAALSRLSTG